MDFPLSHHPLISILIPARNEAEILPASLAAFLQQDYENYEVILVDDGSTDATGEIAKGFEARFPGRLRVIRVDALPEGWVGKSHALHTAFQAASGEWVLATDADIVFTPKALRAGLWAARKHRADLVSIFAFVECSSFWEKMLLPGFSLLLATFFPFRKINDPNSSVAVASGGYILMRRALWAELGGYSLIRSEMIDDLNTARIVKHSGHKLFAAITPDLLSTRMYSSFSEIWEGLRKHAFAGNRYSVFRIIFAVCAILVTNLLPLAGLFYFGPEAYRAGGVASPAAFSVLVLSLAQYLICVGMHQRVMHFYKISSGYALFSPLGAVIYTVISLDSMLKTLFGGGVSWKRRNYGRLEDRKEVALAMPPGRDMSSKE